MLERFFPQVACDPTHATRPVARGAGARWRLRLRRGNLLVGPHRMLRERLAESRNRAGGGIGRSHRYNHQYGGVRFLAGAIPRRYKCQIRLRL